MGAALYNAAGRMQPMGLVFETLNINSNPYLQTILGNLAMYTLHIVQETH